MVSDSVAKTGDLLAIHDLLDVTLASAVSSGSYKFTC